MTKPDKVVQSDINAELESNSTDGVLPIAPQTLPDGKNQQHEVQSSREASAQVKEVGGPKGLEPTRYGDWESKGRCYDF